MRTIEGKGMAHGLFLREISICILVLQLLLGCSPKIGEFRKTEPGKNHYFKAGSKELRIIIPNISVADLKTLRVDGGHTYQIKFIEQVGNDKAKLILTPCSPIKSVPRLAISYILGDSTKKSIDIYFYSNLINFDSLVPAGQVLYHRSFDIVPPLIQMSSLQVSPFKLCTSDSVYEDFSSFRELYIISYLLEPGEYIIADGDCEKPLFKYIIMGNFPLLPRD